MSNRPNAIGRIAASTLSGLHEVLVAWLLAGLVFGTLILIPSREMSVVAHDHARIQPRATMHINPATSACPESASDPCDLEEEHHQATAGTHSLVMPDVEDC